jgi:hypothetical protein
LFQPHVASWLRQSMAYRFYLTPATIGVISKSGLHDNDLHGYAQLFYVSYDVHASKIGR